MGVKGNILLAPAAYTVLGCVLCVLLSTALGEYCYSVLYPRKLMTSNH